MTAKFIHSKKLATAQDFKYISQMFTAIYTVLPLLWPENNLFKHFFLLAGSQPVIFDTIYTM